MQITSEISISRDRDLPIGVLIAFATSKTHSLITVVCVQVASTKASTTQVIPNGRTQPTRAGCCGARRASSPSPTCTATRPAPTHCPPNPENVVPPAQVTNACIFYFGFVIIILCFYLNWIFASPALRGALPLTYA